uniref:Uncharacterized protein n=1 Tax=Anguilla anguilla TaxID=7936 RepID=A0A0E9PMP9_ANGAN
MTHIFIFQCHSRQNRLLCHLALFT